jgi:hypothetical protein
MRIAYSVLITAVMASTVPSVSFAQVLRPFDPHGDYDQRVDHVVPVATVSRVGDIATLADARIVQDASGEPFALGSAKLDLRDPSHAKLVFTMTNSTDKSIPWTSVKVREVRVATDPGDGRPFFGCQIVGAAGRDGTWESNATVTVEIPIAPPCPRFELEGFLVLIGLDRHSHSSADEIDQREVTILWEQEKALLRRAFDKLRSQGQH